MDLVQTLRVEWQVIRQTPFISITAILALTTVGWGVIYWWFKTRIAAKDNLVETLNNQIAALRNDRKSFPESSGLMAQPNNLRQMTNSAAVTGDHNSVSVVAGAHRPEVRALVAEILSRGNDMLSMI
ncbi:MAG: hypothetical protein ABI811_02495 [Acidobacteriota bacterium]